MLLAAQCHLGSKNLQVHMEPYLWKTRPDGVNVINIGKTWYCSSTRIRVLNTANEIVVLGRKSSSQLASSPQLTTPPISPSSLPAHTVNVLSSSLPLIVVLYRCSSYQRSFLRQYPCHCSLRYGLPYRIRRCGYSNKQQRPSPNRSDLVDAGSRSTSSTRHSG